MIPRMLQSRHIAKAMPMTPIFQTTANRIEKTSRTPMVVNKEMLVVSPQAPRPLPGSALLSGSEHRSGKLFRSYP